MKLLLTAALGVLFTIALIANPIQAHADAFNYPCVYPGQGIGAEVFNIGGQFCDGPTEINLTHAHCEGGGAHLGGLGLAGQNGISLGAIGAIGGSGEGCSFRCPDNTVAPAPNPPGVWQHQFIDVRVIIKIGKAFCVRENHLAPAGPTSSLVDPNEGLPNPALAAVGSPEGDVPFSQVGGPREHTPRPGPPTPNGELSIPQLPSIPPIPQLPGIPGIPLP